MKKITLMLAFMLPLAGFAQDTCATAQVITAGPEYSVLAIDGTEIPTPDCSEWGQETTTAAEWFSFTATIDGVAMITSHLPQNEGGDTRVYAFTGECGALTCIGSHDDVNYQNPPAVGNNLSTLLIPVLAGTTYYIAWDNNWSSEGFDFMIMELPVDCDTSVPYDTVFDDANAFIVCYDTADGDGNGVAWIQQALDLTGDELEETFATNGTNGEEPKDDWLFTPSFTLEEGETYVVTYRFSGANSQTALANETLEVLITNTPEPNATFQEQLGLYEAVGMAGANLAQAYANAPIESGEFTAPTSGNYHIAFHTMSPPNSAFLLLFDYGISVSLATPTFELTKVNMYPNPVSNVLNISNESLISSVEVTNLMGQKVLAQDFNSNEVQMNMSQLAAGAYMVKVVSANGNQMMKIIKQ